LFSISETKKDSQVLADQIKYVNLIDTAMSHFADTQRQLNEALAGIETLKNELNGKIANDVI
jgi:hypothetical protein